MEKIADKRNFKEKQAMCLDPVDDFVETQFRALHAINSFKKMGFDSWKAFYEIMVEKYPNADEVQVYKKLHAFWALRNFRPEIVQNVEMVLESLKAE